MKRALLTTLAACASLLAYSIIRVRVAVYLWPALMCYAGAQSTGVTEGMAQGQMDLLRGTYSFRQNGLKLHAGRDEVSIVAENLWVSPASFATLFNREAVLQGGADGMAILYAPPSARASFSVLSDDPGDPPLAFGRPLRMAKFSIKKLTISTPAGARLTIAELDLFQIKAGFGSETGLSSVSATGSIRGLDLADGMWLSGSLVISNGYALLKDPDLTCGRGRTVRLKRAVVALNPPFSSELRPANGCDV